MSVVGSTRCIKHLYFFPNELLVFTSHRMIQLMNKMSETRPTCCLTLSEVFLDTFLTPSLSNALASNGHSGNGRMNTIYFINQTQSNKQRKVSRQLSTLASQSLLLSTSGKDTQSIGSGSFCIGSINSSSSSIPKKRVIISNTIN